MDNEPQIKNLSSSQVKRVVSISERDSDRANRVLDRMKKRKGIEGATEIVKGVGIKRQFTPKEQEISSGTGGLKGATPLASGSSEFKQVDLKSESKPLASGSSGFKQVDLKSNPAPLSSGSSKFKYVELKKPQLSQEEMDKVSNIKNPNRAKRVLDRMKKEKGISTTKII